MKKTKIILTLILCLSLISIFFVGCGNSNELIEAESTISPYTEFSGIGATLNTIEIKNESILLHYTLTVRDNETAEAATQRITDKVTSLNKRVVKEKSYDKGQRAFTLKETKNEDNTKIKFVVYSKYLSNISSSYVKRMPLEEYLKSYDVNKDNYVNVKGAKVDLGKISQKGSCYYIKVYSPRDDVSFKVNGKIITAKAESNITDNINNSTAYITKEVTEFVYSATNNTLLWILLPITLAILVVLVILVIKKFVTDKNKGTKRKRESEKR